MNGTPVASPLMSPHRLATPTGAAFTDDWQCSIQNSLDSADVIMGNGSRALPATPLAPLTKSVSVEALPSNSSTVGSPRSNGSGHGRRSSAQYSSRRSSVLIPASSVAPERRFAPNSAASQAHHMIDGQESALAAHTARLAARCDELEWIQRSLQQENDRWRQEVDTLRNERIHLEQELREAETRLALLRPVTPIGVNSFSLDVPYRSPSPTVSDTAAEPLDAIEDMARDSVSFDVPVIVAPVPDRRKPVLPSCSPTMQDTVLGAYARADEPTTSPALTEQLRAELQRTSDKLMNETRRRGELEQAKANIEGQLEDLSRTVFEEAQKMVVEERHARAEAERKRDLFAARVRELQDVEQMLKAQLDALKRMVESVSTQAAEPVSAPPTITEFHGVGDVIEEEEDSDQDEMEGEAADISKQRRMARRAARGSVASIASASAIDATSAVDSATTVAIAVTAAANTSSAAATDPVAALLAFEAIGRRYADFDDFYRMCAKEANIISTAYTQTGYNASIAEAAALAVEPATPSTSKFLRRCQSDDVEPCVRFERAGYFTQRKITSGVQAGSLILEPVAASDMRQLFAYQTMVAAPGSVFRPPCTLCERPCNPDACHRLFLEGEREASRYGDPGNNALRLVCPDCRLRLVAACEFWAYVRLLRRGLVRAPPEQIYSDILRHRLRMFLARTGVRGASTLAVHGAHTAPAVNGVQSRSSQLSATELSRSSSVASNGTAPKVTSVNAVGGEASIRTSSNYGSQPSSPHIAPSKQLMGGGRDPELAESHGPSIGSNINAGASVNANANIAGMRTQWRSSMVDAVAGARRSWATLSQMSF